MSTTTRTRLSADRAARFLERAISARSLDAATQADAQTLLESIDAGTVRGLNGAVEALIAAGFQRGALAVAAADSPRETRRGVGAIRAVASLAGALGVGVAAEPDVEPDPAPEVEPDPVADPVPAEPVTSTAWGVA